VSAYEGSWSRVFAEEAARQAREDICPNSAPETALAIEEMIARAMETPAND